MESLERLRIAATDLASMIDPAQEMSNRSELAAQWIGLNATIAQLEIEKLKADAATAQARAFVDMAAVAERFSNLLGEAFDEDGALHVVTHTAGHLRVVK